MLLNSATKQRMSYQTKITYNSSSALREGGLKELMMEEDPWRRGNLPPVELVQFGGTLQGLPWANHT